MTDQLVDDVVVDAGAPMRRRSLLKGVMAIGGVAVTAGAVAASERDAFADTPTGTAATDRAAGPYDAAGAIYNATPDATRNIRIGAARAMGGGLNFVLKGVGDSVTNGHGASSWATSFLEVFANRFSRGSILPAHGRGFQKGSINFAPGDSHQTYSSSGWTSTFGFGMNTSNNGGTWTIACSAAENVDQFTLYLQAYSSRCKFSITIDGVAPTSNASVQMATPGIYTVSFPTSSSGAHTLVLTVVGGSFSPLGYVARSNGPNGGAVVHHLGFNGTTSGANTDFSSTTSSGQMTIDMLPADCTFITYLDNDYNQQVPISTYTSNLVALGGRCRTNGGGDPVIVIPPPVSTTAYSGDLSITPQNYVDAAYSAADQIDCALIDFYQVFNSYAVSSASGVYSDSIHPSDLGYMLMSSTWYSFLQKIATGV